MGEGAPDTIYAEGQRRYVESRVGVPYSRDETDARRHYVRLTDAGRERMSAYFAECRAGLIGEMGLLEALTASGTVSRAG